MARSENASNHKLKQIKEIFHRFHEINPPSARNFVLTPKELADKKVIINPKNEVISVCYMQQAYQFLVMNLVIKIQKEYLKNY